MKEKLKLFSVILLVGTLVSCASGQGHDDPGKYEGRVKSVEMTIVNISDTLVDVNDPRNYEDSKPIEAYYKKDKVKMYYLDEIDEVYFLTLDSFANIFKDELAEGMTFTTEESNGVATWTVNKNDKLFYRISMNANDQTMSVDSNIDDSFVKTIYKGKTGLNDYAQLEEEYVTGHENKTRVYNWGKYGFDYFEVDGKYAYPFALLSAELSKNIERSFYYISEHEQMIEFNDGIQLDNSFLVNNQEIIARSYVFTAYNNRYSNHDEEDEKRVAPATLTAFNKKLFYFIMDNYYGIASEKHIKSMSAYFETFKEADDFLSTDGVTRGSAYFRAIQMLNDMHSSYSYSTFFSESAAGDGSSIYSQTFFGNRNDYQAILGNIRKASIDKYNAAHNTDLVQQDVRYSADNKYAYFSFDDFLTFNYYGEGAVPEDEQVKDPFYLFVRNLNEAKAKGVKNVIIDASLNGGGYVNIMGKLLALMSKDNKSEMYLHADDNDSIIKYTTRVDSNKDGKYDVSDCYGNDFTFYVVCSNYSFSCGNAFPFYAQKYGLAKIIGQKSGGGECCVFSYNFPTGQGLGYSSPFHLGYYDAATDTYYGDEKGAAPIFSITDSFYEIYDPDVVGARIDLYNNRP